MPRKYIARENSYNKYDVNLIAEAVKAYKSGKKSLKCIAEKFKINKSVLYRHATRTMKRHGGQTALSEETEEMIIKYVNLCASWGYPLDSLDLRFLVKYYLDKIGRMVTKFKNNFPGPDFVRGFLKRHKDKISQRKTRKESCNIKNKVVKSIIDVLKEMRSGKRKRKLEVVSSEYYEQEELKNKKKRSKTFVTVKKQTNYIESNSDKNLICDKKIIKKHSLNVNEKKENRMNIAKGKGKKSKGNRKKEVKENKFDVFPENIYDTKSLNAQNIGIYCFSKEVIEEMSIEEGDFVLYDGNEMVIAENFISTVFEVEQRV